MTPNGRVANKVALVTGAASGIGRATALLLAQEGAAVVVADIAAEAGQQVAQEISRSAGKAVFQPLDVTQETAWQNVSDRILQDFARLDIAVNNAGVAVSRPVAWCVKTRVRFPFIFKRCGPRIFGPSTRQPGGGSIGSGQAS